MHYTNNDDVNLTPPTTYASVTAGETASFEERLNLLFECVVAPTGVPFASATVVRWARRHQHWMSNAYLSQLRTGVRTKPSTSTMYAIADFFRVPDSYFTDDASFAAIARELRLDAAVRQNGTLRRLVDVVADLSPAGRQELLSSVEELEAR